MQSITESSYWEERYQEQTPRWDLGEAAPGFLNLLNSENKPKPGKTAVLGCGRGYDAVLFAEHGFEVVGFDFAPTAITDSISLAQKSQSTATFLQRDIFDLATEFPHHFDYVVEHTCFCAIPPERRDEYVKLVRSILRPNGELIAVFFTHNRPGGPPFGATPAEIRQYFEADFEVLMLEPVLNSVPSRQGEEHLGLLRVR
ncbi:MAG: methyltransferase domain-containing protein [Coleofasciculaceae cyanobacterium]